MQQDQYDKIKGLIQSSPVLQDAERAAWIAMLPVMNDKQVADLFGILRTKAPSPVIDNSPAPHLRHISNLPTEIEYPSHLRAVSKPQVQVHPQNSKVNQTFAQKLDQQLKEKEISAAPARKLLEDEEQIEQHIKPKLVLPFEQNHGIKVQKQTAQFVPLIKNKPLQINPSAGGEESPIKLHPEALNVLESVLPLPLVKVEELATVTTANLRQQGYDYLSQKAHVLQSKAGYFATVLYFEKSPLYQDYLKTGSILLQPNTTVSDDLPLSKTEFEQITDLLADLARGY